MGVHDGHRERLRTTFIENGLDCFNELNSLELLLFYSIPRKDTNEIAHRLLDRFCNLQGVLDASYHELLSVEGIGEQTAALIKLIPQLTRKAQITLTNEIKEIKTSKAAGKYFIPRFMGQKEEVMLLLCLDANKRVISCAEISRGTVNAVETSIRRILETALKFRASYVILAHNHPDGEPYPSREDDATTKQVSNSLRCVDIPLVDHIIVSGDQYAAYSDSSLFKANMF